MSHSSSNGLLGKYREIIIAVAFFLVFDLAVLLLNFFISFQISDSATDINLAGRQRMLSQRMTKELLTAADLSQQHRSPDESLADFHKSVALFDQTLTGFRSGGDVKGGDGAMIRLKGVTSTEGKTIVAEADAIWQPFLAKAERLKPGTATHDDIAAATGYALRQNVKLLGLMNKLTTHLEQAASERANMLRKVQTGGILLALLNFAFILFKFLRRLRENDRKVEQAQSETAEILNTVKEGLFLLDHDLRIGSQFSSSLPKILGQPIVAGDDFRLVLGKLVDPGALQSACEYIDLLLGDRVRESLVQDLNPLTNMEVMIPDENGHPGKRYLTLQFSRAFKDGVISHLLVTVFDVTTQMELEQELSEARRKAKAEMEVMLDLLKINPAVLKQFLDRTEMTLLEVNDHLRHANPEADSRRTISHIFRLIHSIKGEAAALDLEIFEELAQRFELQLAALRSKGQVSGEDLLGLPLPLDEFLQRINDVRELSRRLASYQNEFAPEEEAATVLANSMRALANRIASDHAKQVQIHTQLDIINEIPDFTRRHLNDIALQLLRNSLVHGIETVDERIARMKSAAGNIHVELKRIDDEYELCVRDDGMGLSPRRLREELLRRGLYTASQLQDLSDKQVIMKIFEAGFSTASTVDRDAGQGVGMDVVRDKVKQLGARLRISTRENAYTEINIRFAA